MKINEVILEYKNTPLEDFGGLQFRIVKDYPELIVHAFEPEWSNEIAHVVFNIGDNNELDPQDLFVKDRFRGAGVAKVMYDYVKSKGYAIHRSYDQTPAGAGFWDKHRGDERVWEEVNLQKNTWELLVSTADKSEVGDNLVDLVQTAYANTTGSMVNSLRDVVPSDWRVLDWDHDPDVDACVFYRKPRGNEHWTGHKIQGIGHDGASVSKRRVIEQVVNMLGKPGVWIESSDAMRHVLNKLNVPAVTDVAVLKRLFNDADLQMIDRNTYRRRLPDGTTITETVFGHPKVK